MLCSLKTPKSYQIKYDISDSPVVKLFISGSDVKKMVEGSESMLKLTHRNIQLNGIYRLAAEIKSVDLLQHHSCILWSDFSYQMFPYVLLINLAMRFGEKLGVV